MASDNERLERDEPEQDEQNGSDRVPRYADVSLTALQFDPDNPRFPQSLDGNDESEVLKFMLEDAGLIDLMRSIAAQGFFPGEPLLVCPGTASGRWMVVEGNRRLAASKLLADPSSAPTRSGPVAKVASAATPPKALPCLQFSSRGDILKHLGYRHVTGIKEWEPLEKARFLKQRFDELTGPPAPRFQELARTIGSRSDYVGRLLASLAIFEHANGRAFYNLSDVSESTVDFSLISSVLAYSNIVEYLGLSNAQDVDLQNLRDDRVAHLFRWVFERPDGRRRTILGESRNIKILAEVVASEQASSALEGGASLQAAYELIGGAKEFKVYVEGARQNLVLAREQVEGANLDSQALVAVDEVAAAVNRLREAVAAHVGGDS